MCVQTACCARTQWSGKSHARVQRGIELMCVYVMIAFFMCVVILMCANKALKILIFLVIELKLTVVREKQFI